MKRILIGLCTASLLVLGACNSQSGNQAQPFTPGQQTGPVPGGNGPYQPPANQGGGPQSPMVQQAVAQCIQNARGAPQAQQMCNCFGNALGSLPPEQIAVLESNQQQAQQYVMQVMQQCASGAMGGGNMGPGGVGPGGMGPGGMGPGGMGPGGMGPGPQPGYGPQPGMYGGSAQGANSQTK